MMLWCPANMLFGRCDLKLGHCFAQKLMMSMQIKVTPTFCFYRGTDVVRTVTGINEDNLRNAVKEELQQGASQPLPASK